MIIAIDGPAASGKSTVGRDVASRLAYLYFDTGVMYRAVAWVALQRGISLEDSAAITSLTEGLDIDVRPPSCADGRVCDVIVDGQDISWQIKSPEVDATVSLVAAMPGVRADLSRRQRAIGLRGDVVMVGRDIGTVILPDADLKIYLDASVEERARRRTEEVLERGREADYEEVLASMKNRDAIDAGREVAPLKPAVDAVIINSDDLTIAQVVGNILEIVGQQAG